MKNEWKTYMGMGMKNAGVLLLLLWPFLVNGQGFLHADGKRIVNGDGENVILRGIGTGNWMLQEGYMMNTADVAGTQHAFREKLIQSIGEARTDSFYSAWLANHFTRTDVDSMASWGFNSVRVAMHYKWLTLPIEEEPVEGEQTWLEDGFVMLDSLLDWCGDREMYLILDMHGTPGGQGKNADISDYDPSKPSLWESPANKKKLVALWQKLAARYADEPWIGGYDLINETNWSFPENNNSQMRKLYMEITDSIRAVDSVHIIYIEGNGFANDFSGLTPPWDDNMVYSFHKYWTFNFHNSLEWVTSLRDRYNVPLWLGETGENSNTWFTNLVSLSESQNIGWSWWPVKKGGINNPLEVDFNEDYLQLVDNWRGKGPMLSEDEAFRAVMTLAARHHIDSCIYHRDVVDALIRQPHSTETLPFRNWQPGEAVLACDYDLGRNGFAYLDKDTANYHGDMGGQFTTWNGGWAYRNDGVDMEADKDTQGNGFTVGWTDDGEWLQYTLKSDSAATYSLQMRLAGFGGKIHMEVNGVDATGTINLPSTGSWTGWQTHELGQVVLPKGEFKLKMVIDQGGSNFNFFRFTDPISTNSQDFQVISARTGTLDSEVFLALTKEVHSPESIDPGQFSMTTGSSRITPESVKVNPENPRGVILGFGEPLFYNQVLRFSYGGTEIMHGDEALAAFENMSVNNHLVPHYTDAMRIQSEDFYINRGLQLEDCTDAGGGRNTAYAHHGDFLDYVIYVEKAGAYILDFRVATIMGNARLQLSVDRGEGFEDLGSMRFQNTGGWQNWKTQDMQVELEEGKQVLRLTVTGDEHNLNWIQFNSIVGLEEERESSSFELYPNPASGLLTIDLGGVPEEACIIEIYDAAGSTVYQGRLYEQQLVLDVSAWLPGIYLVALESRGEVEIRKLLR